MPILPRDRQIVRFCEFEADLRSLELRRGATPVALQRQPFELLAMLLARPGELVTREEMKQRLWPDETFVDFDLGLNAAMRKLRRALGESATRPRFIETLARRGYRFLGSVEHPAGRGASRRLLLAVIPFDNLSGDPKQEYFSDGLTEEMITQLGRLHPERLGVIARTSVMRYKGAKIGVDRIGRELGVDYVLEGSVRRAGGRVRVTVQLIQVRDQTHLWAESYDERLRDVLSMQSGVAARVAEATRLKLSVRERELLDAGHPVDPVVHDAVLRGRYWWNRRTRHCLEKAITCFEQALERDAECAPALAGLADCYAILPITSDVAPREAFPKAEAAARRASAVDDKLAETYAVLGTIRFWFDWDWSAAAKNLRRAIELNPSDTDARLRHAHLLSNLGRHEEALSETRQVQAVDPFSPIVNTLIGGFLYHAHDYESASRQLLEALGLAPEFWVAHIYLGRVRIAQERFAEAAAECRRAFKASGENAEGLAQGVYALARQGRKKAARAVRDELVARARRTYVPPYDLALASLGLGETDQALDWLDRGVEDRDVRLTFLKVVHLWDPIRRRARFRRILDRVGLCS